MKPTILYLRFLEVLGAISLSILLHEGFHWLKFREPLEMRLVMSGGTIMEVIGRGAQIPMALNEGIAYTITALVIALSTIIILSHREA